MTLDLIPYHKKKVLIIEDLAEMRSTMKSMLANMGVQSMETVNNGEEALAKMANNEYDIVFSDYELGRGKDGQQILEEVRHSGLIPASTVYILVTAAQTVEMVMGALEYEPDGYITKPVTLEILRTRLNRIIRTKDVYQEINRAIDRKDINGALEACNRLAVENPKFALPAYRIKGKLLLNENRIEEAKDIYDTVLGIKRVAWAMLGMGKVLYLQGEYDEAQRLLEGLANTKAQYVEAFDWLAKVLEAQGKYKAAQSVLEKAIEESPKSVLRQQELARIAELNGDTDTLYKACRKAHGLAKNSVFRNVDILVRYAKALLPKVKHGSMRDQKIAVNECMALLEQAATEFSLTTAQTFKCDLVKAQCLFHSGKEEDGRKSYELALALLKENNSFSLDDRMDLFSAKLLFENEGNATEYGKSVVHDSKNNRRIETNFYRIMDFHLTKRPEERVELLKIRGQELLERSEFDDAFELLYKATRIDVSNVDAQLLALKSAIGLYKQGARSSDTLSKANDLFKMLEQLDKNDPRFPTLEKLRLQWTEQNSNAAAG